MATKKKAAHTHAWKDWTERLQAFTAAVGALVAVAAGVVLLGALVVGFRLWIYQLPWEVALIQLGQGALLAVGLAEVVGPLFAIFVLYALVEVGLEQLIGGNAPDNTPSGWRAPFKALGWTWTRSKKDWHAWARIVVWSVGGWGAVLVGRILLAQGWDLIGGLISLGLTLVGALTAIGVLTWLSDPLAKWPAEARLFLVSVLVVFVGFLPLVCANAITLSLPYAVVCPTKTQTMVAGWLIGEANDRVLLGSADLTGKEVHYLLLAPSKDTRIMETDKKTIKNQLPQCPLIPNSKAAGDAEGLGGVPFRIPRTGEWVAAMTGHHALALFAATEGLLLS